MSWKGSLNEWRATMLNYYKAINSWMPIQTTSEEFIDDTYHDTTENIVAIGNSCGAAKDVLSRYNLKGDIYKYIQEHHSSIGTDIHKGREGNCTEFLAGFYTWVAAGRPAKIPVRPPYLPPVYDPDPDPEPKPDPTPEPTPDEPCPRGRQYQAPLIGGCDSGYYREKKWGRDLCICEEGESAENWLTKFADYLSGNFKMVLIAMIVIVIGVVFIKLSSKKVSVG